jgi:hypothetical protein
MIMITKDVVPQLTLENTLWQAFRRSYHEDHANAALHCATVRYSPLTFRLAEQCWVMGARSMEVSAVILDLGDYVEDLGR